MSSSPIASSGPLVGPFTSPQQPVWANQLYDPAAGTPTQTAVLLDNVPTADWRFLQFSYGAAKDSRVSISFDTGVQFNFDVRANDFLNELVNVCGDRVSLIVLIAPTAGAGSLVNFGARFTNRHELGDTPIWSNFNGTTEPNVNVDYWHDPVLVWAAKTVPAAGSVSLDIPAYRGPVQLWCLLPPAVGFLQIVSRRFDNLDVAAPGVVTFEIANRPAGSVADFGPLTLELPPRINTLVLGNTNAAAQNANATLLALRRDAVAA